MENSKGKTVLAKSILKKKIEAPYTESGKKILEKFQIENRNNYIVSTKILTNFVSVLKPLSKHLHAQDS